MLRPKKKITKKEIKQDKLVSTYFKVYDKIYDYRKHLLFGGIAIIAVVLIGIIYYTNMQSENERAMTELGKVYPLYDEARYEQAIEGVPEQNIMGLRNIAANYSRTEAGRIASFYLANAYYHLGEYDQAYRYFSEFRGSDELLRASALAGRAAIYEVRDEYSKAAEYYERAANRYGETAVTPENLKHAGRNYLEAGEYEDALRVFEKLQDEYPESIYTQDVERYIAQIRVAS